MLKLLVADDNPISLDFLATAVRQLGWQCTTAIDGAEATNLAEHSSFNLILLDARMPVLDGPGALACIRSGAGMSRHTPALATTAGTESQRHAELIAAGFAAVLTKPIRLAALAVAINTYARSKEDSPVDPADNHFDERRALAAAGGDAQIVLALRSLLLTELERLPTEMIAAERAPNASVSLAERMHRLQASAGFCGLTGLEQAARELEHRAKMQLAWPTGEVDALLTLCRSIAGQLYQPSAG